jgi:hypothetical protein
MKQYEKLLVQVSPVPMPCPSLRSVAPPPALPMYTKDSLKKDGVYWLAV